MKIFILMRVIGLHWKFLDFLAQRLLLLLLLLLAAILLLRTGRKCATNPSKSLDISYRPFLKSDTLTFKRLSSPPTVLLVDELA